MTRYFILPGWLIALSLFSFAQASAESNIQFVLDLSGSMRQKLGGETQIESALKAMSSALDEIPPSGMTAVRVYGHRVEQTNKDESCKDTELVIPFQKRDKAKIIEALRALSPKGYTPIAYSLDETRNDLLDVSMDKEAERVVVLLTDGEETCGGDPVGTLKKLRDEGFKLKVFTVGFNINDVARKQLQEIAEFSGGKFFDAKDGSALNSALREATKASVEAAIIPKAKAVYGEAIRGGNSFEDAVPLPQNKELKLDHHQRQGDYDYFYIEAKRGEKITVQLATLEKGISLTSREAVETNGPYAGFLLTDAKRQKLLNKDIIGTAFKRETGEFLAGEDGRYYLLIGTTYSPMNKDHVTFSVKREMLGDANTDRDAGAAPETALPIQAGRFPSNYIGSADQIDVFSFDAKQGQKVLIGVVPNAAENDSFGVRVFDDFKQIFESAYVGSNSGFKSKELSVGEDGTYYLEIKLTSERLNNYTIVLKVRDSDALPK